MVEKPESRPEKTDMKLKRPDLGPGAVKTGLKCRF